jgi:hypothetical protein
MTGVWAIAIASAVVPTVIANAIYLPRHLLPELEAEQQLEQHPRMTRPRQAVRKPE